MKLKSHKIKTNKIHTIKLQLSDKEIEVLDYISGFHDIVSTHLYEYIPPISEFNDEEINDVLKELNSIMDIIHEDSNAKS